MKRCMLGLLLGLMLCGAATAGNVSAIISGGNLFLYGDNTGSSIAIDSPSAGQIQVTGFPTPTGENTVVNGTVNGTVILDGWTSGIYSYSYAGDDSVTLSAALVNGHVHIDLGSGNDEVFIGTSPMAQAINALGAEMGMVGAAQQLGFDPAEGAVVIQNTLLVIGADGNDYVDVVQTWVGQAATFDLGQGWDEIYLGLPNVEEPHSVDIQGNCVIIPGIDPDDVSLESVRVGHNLVVDDATGPLRLYVFDTEVGNSMFVYGSSSNDRVDMAAISVNEMLRIIAEGGDDVIIVRGASRFIDLFAGAGNDRVRVADVDTERINAFLDPGDDDFLLQRGNTGRLNAYGSSGNDLFSIRFANVAQAYIYGDSGTDTYAGVPGNNIGSLNLYSIENQ